MSPPTVPSSLRQNGLAHQALGLLLAMRKMRWRGGQWVAGPFCAFPPSEARSQPWHSLFLPLLWKVEALGPDFPPSRKEGRVRTGGRVNRPGGVGNWWVGGNWAQATKGRVFGKGNNPLRRPTWELIWKRKQTEDSVAKKKKKWDDESYKSQISIHPIIHSKLVKHLSALHCVLDMVLLRVCYIGETFKRELKYSAI